MSYELRDKAEPVKRKKAAVGSFEHGKSKSPRVVISFDGHQFLLISTLAKRQGISFAAAVRELIDEGLCQQNWNKEELECSPERWMAAYGIGQRRTENGGL